MVSFAKFVGAHAFSFVAISSALATSELFVTVGQSGEEITFARAEFGPQNTVFDELIYPTEVGRFAFDGSSSGSLLTVQEGNATQSIFSTTTISNFEIQALLAITDFNFNNYLNASSTFSFADTFSYELAFASPLLDDVGGAQDEAPELLFTSNDKISYIWVEALEAAGGARVPGSNGYLVDTNGWFPAMNVDTMAGVPQAGGTALYAQGVDLSLLGVSSAKYFRVSSVSATTPGVTTQGNRAVNTGLSAIGIQTAVPEPSSALLVLAVFAGLAVRRRK